jgi:hypothetical protein
LRAKCAGLDDAQLVMRSAPPSPLSLLGLVRHLTEMERAYGTWALGPKADLVWGWGEYTDGGPEWDIDANESMVQDSLAAWAREKRTVDELISAHQTLDSIARATDAVCDGISRGGAVDHRWVTIVPLIARRSLSSHALT